MSKVFEIKTILGIHSKQDRNSQKLTVQQLFLCDSNVRSGARVYQLTDPRFTLEKIFQIIAVQYNWENLVEEARQENLEEEK